MLLVIDTCFEACSAALYDAAEGVVASRFEPMERGHAEALGPMVESLLNERAVTPRTLTRIAVTIGPGTFTGLRIGLAYAKGMALALGIPLVGIDSLTATAAPQFSEGKSFAVVQKAGATGLFYWAAFDGARMTHALALGEMKDISADHDILSVTMPDAKLFAAHAATLAPQASVTPLYLRAPDAKQSVDAKPVVRPVTASDFAVMSNLHAESFETGWTAQDLRAMSELPGAGALVVELAGTLYGFIQFQWVAGEAEINTICVSPNHRRQHFGRDLMSGLMAHLSTLSTARVFLEVAADNRAALKLYDAFGFQPIGVRKGYYKNGQDALQMSKDIRP